MPSHLDAARREWEAARREWEAAVERLLAERVALCWVEVHTLDIATNANVGNAYDRFDRRRDRAHRRYLQTLRALAAVRRLDLTAVQVNGGVAPAAPANGGLSLTVRERISDPVDAPGVSADPSAAPAVLLRSGA
jgi:hypothetical protein